MTHAELATIAQEGIKVNIAIINNGYLGMVRQWQEFFYERPLRGDAAAEPRLREARRGHGLRGVARHASAARSSRRCRRARAPGNGA